MLILRDTSLVIECKKDLMSYEDWFAKYQPIKNVETDDYYYEDGDEVLEEYMEDHPCQVWTFFDEGDDGYIVPGMPDDVNQINYYLTKVPFGPDMPLCVSFDDMDDDWERIKSLIDDLERLKGRAAAAGESNSQEIEDCMGTIQDKVGSFEFNWGVPFVLSQALQNPTPTAQTSANSKRDDETHD